MVSQLETYSAGFVALVSFVQFLYFFRAAQLRKSSWSSAYVTFVEFGDYAITLLLYQVKAEFKSGTIIFNGAGVPVHILRYVEWLISCPIIVNEMVVLERILLQAEALSAKVQGINLPKDAHKIRLDTEVAMALILSMLSCAILTSLAVSTHWKITFLIIGGMLCSALLFTFFRLTIVYKAVMPSVFSARILAPFFAASWLLFPVCMILSPMGFGFVSEPLGNVLFTFAELPAKNILLVIMTKVHSALHHRIRELESQLLASTSSGTQTDFDDEHHSAKMPLLVQADEQNIYSRIGEVERELQLLRAAMKEFARSDAILPGSSLASLESDSRIDESSFADSRTRDEY